LSGVAHQLIVRNDADLAVPLIEYTRTICDEIVIGIDETSTIDVAAPVLKAKGTMPGLVFFFQHELWPDGARNMALANTRSPWALTLDADEWPTEECVTGLARFLADPGNCAAATSTIEHRIDGKLLRCEPQYRLFKSSVRYAGGIHEGLAFQPGDTICMDYEKVGIIQHHKTRSRQNRSDARNTVWRTEHLKPGIYDGSPVRLNVGSGPTRLPGFINIDIEPYENTDLIWDFTPQMDWNEHTYPYPGHLPWEDGCVDEVLASHVLEHFRYHHACDLIRDWCRVLKPGGRIEIATPDFEAVWRGLADGSVVYLQAIQNLYAGETVYPPGTWDYHYNCVDFAWLKGQLHTWGCELDSMRRLPGRTGGGILELRVEARKSK
jgi:SAM-dependent methyltransferase